MSARAAVVPVPVARVLPAAMAGAIVFHERSLEITTTAAGELCVAVTLPDGDVDAEQILDRDDVRRLIAALDQWLGVRFELTPAGRAAAAYERDVDDEVQP